jgi:hypothetical protein
MFPKIKSFLFILLRGMRAEEPKLEPVTVGEWEEVPT